MKVLDAISEPKAPSFSKATMETVRRQVDREWDEFGVKILMCTKCGGTICRFAGQWSRLENDHGGVEHAVASHVCTSQADRLRQLRREMAQYAIDLRLMHPELTRRQVKIARNKFFRYLKTEENL